MVKVSLLRQLYWLVWLLPIIPCYGLTMPVPGQVIAEDATAASDFPHSPTLTLQEAVLLAMRNNPDVKNAELNRVVDKFALAVARNAFWPQYSVTGKADYKSGSKPGYSAGQSVSLLMPFGTTLSTGLNQTYNPGTDPRVLNNANFSIKQPLLRGFGSAVTQVNLANAIDSEKANQLFFKSNVISTIVNVVNSYYQLVEAYNNLKVNQLSLQDAEQTLQQTVMKINAGKAAPTEQIQQQATIATTQLSIAQAQNNIRQSYQNLLAILGLDPQAKLNIVKHLEAIKAVPPSLEESIQIALEKNTNYQTQLLNYQITQRALITQGDEQKWQLDATAGLNQALNKMSGTPSTDKSLTLDLNIPIHDLQRQQGLVSAKIALQQAKTTLEQAKRQLITDVTNAYQDLKFNQQQIVLYEDSIRLAQRNLEIAKTKFSYGKISSFELTTIQSSLTTTQLGYVTQQITYLNSVENFYQLLGTTLDKWHIGLVY